MRAAQWSVGTVPDSVHRHPARSRFCSNTTYDAPVRILCRGTTVHAIPVAQDPCGSLSIAVTAFGKASAETKGVANGFLIDDSPTNPFPINSYPHAL